jgi:hypothetical protein
MNVLALDDHTVSLLILTVTEAIQLTKPDLKLTVVRNWFDHNNSMAAENPDLCLEGVTILVPEGVTTPLRTRTNYGQPMLVSLVRKPDISLETALLGILSAHLVIDAQIMVTTCVWVVLRLMYMSFLLDKETLLLGLRSLL